MNKFIERKFFEKILSFLLIFYHMGYFFDK